MDKIKVLYLVGSNKFSGAENVVCTIINNMDDSIECLYCCPKGPIEEQLNNRNINYKLIDKLSYNCLKQIIKKYKPNIIHAHDYRATFYASLFYKKCKIVSHIHVNNPLMNKKTFYSILFNGVFKRISNIVWVSDSALDNYCYKTKVLNKSQVIYNVIDSKYIEKRTKEYDPKEFFDLVFIGRLSTQKNPERLIDIIEMIKQKNDNIRLAILGDGEKKNELEELIESKKVSKNVKMYGFQENPYPILKNSKILIMTSRWEGTPMVALEAQALGKPIISTPVDGMKKIINNDVNGYLADNNNELVDHVISYLEDKNYLKLCKNVKDNFKKINNEKEYFNKIKKLYITE